MPALLGKKVGMTSIFDGDGKIIPVTVVEAGPCTVVNIKTFDKNGYKALQLGFDKANIKKINRALKCYFEKQAVEPSKMLKEFREFDIENYKVGDVITVDIFKEGDFVKVTGKSKGKGFQGVMKRHGFSGVGGTTHGQSDRLRAPGSIGSSSYPSRVFKGQRMAGHMGDEQVTVRNLKIIKVLPEKNIIFIKGALPGSNNSIVEIIK